MEAVTSTGPCWLCETGLMFRPPTRRTVHVLAIRRTDKIAVTVLWLSFMALAFELKVSACKSLIFRVMSDYRSEALKAAKHVSETLCGIVVLRKSVPLHYDGHPGASGVLSAPPPASPTLSAPPPIPRIHLRASLPVNRARRFQT